MGGTRDAVSDAFKKEEFKMGKMDDRLNHDASLW